MRLAAKRTMLLLGSLVVAFGVGEGLSRLLLPPPQIHVYLADHADPASPVKHERAQGRDVPTDSTLYVSTPTGSRLRPNSRVIIQNHYLSRRTIEITTNALGYRNPALGAKTRRRVLFLGDSITFAGYVAEKETFVRLVEQLSARGPEPLETINTGVDMIGLTTELAILNETGLSTRPDVVVLGFYLNDLQDSFGLEVLKAPGWLGKSVLAHHLLRTLSLILARRDMDSYLRTVMSREPQGDFSLETWKTWRDEVAKQFPPGEGDPSKDPAAFHSLIQKHFMDWGSAWSDRAWEYMAPVFRQFKELADRRGFALRIVVFPVRQQVVADFVADYPQRKLRAVADSLGVPMLDLLPVLREQHRNQGEPLFYDHCHHTPLGQRIIAEQILDFLTKAGGAARARASYR